MGILNGKVAIITGAGYGVGEGIATAYAKEGATIVAAGRTESKLVAACAKLEELGVKTMSIVCDVANPDDIQRTVDKTIAKFGAVDIMVNNAHTISLGTINDVDDAGFAATFDTGPFATFRFMKAVYPHMKAKGGGHILNLGTCAAMRWDAKGYGIYAASKEAVRSLSRAAACEWAADGIRVNTILPLATSPGLAGWMEADPAAANAFLATVPLGYVGDSEIDIGRVAVFLVSPDARYLTGVTIPVDGGQAYMG
jgi:meso-butanediol dehydrogenase / (S,S)-butanediol dehydrogenase / diacetyl reductase